MSKNLSNKFVDLDLDTYDFHNLMVTCLSQDTSVVIRLYDDSISSFYLKLLTDRQTDKRRVKHNLPGGSN